MKKYKALWVVFLLLFAGYLFSQNNIGDYKTITVQKNENLNILAAKYLKSNKFSSDLLRYNRITEDKLIPGVSIKVPYSISKDRVAKVKFLKGNVQRNAGKQWRRLNRSGLVILQNEKVRTGKRSRLELQFDDGSMLQLAANSVMSLKEYSYSRQGRKANINLTSGSLLANVNKLRKNSAFQISTVTAVVGVRGTQFYVEIDENKTVKVEVYEGQVQVKGKNGLVSLKSGYQTTIKTGLDPQEPVKILSRRKLNWAK